MRLLQNTYEEDYPGLEPNTYPWRDIQKTSDVVAEIEPKKGDNANLALQYEWFRNPSKLDLEDVDVENPPWMDTPKSKKDKKQKRALVAVLGGKEDRETVRKIIESNFNDKEREYMHGTVIDVTPFPPKRDVVGFYRANGNGYGNDYIAVWVNALYKDPDKAGPNAGNTIDENALTHELVHLLNYKDEYYGDRIRSVDDDLDEQITDAETLARIRQGPVGRKDGYYEMNMTKSMTRLSYKAYGKG